MGDHFISGLREFIEILMAYSIDIPYIGHHILTAYLFILNSIERILSSFRSDEESENSDEYENSSICSEETLVSEENGGTLDFSESEDDIEIKVVFLDDRRETLKVHPDSRLKSIKNRLISESSVNLRYVQNGKVLDDSLS